MLSIWKQRDCLPLLGLRFIDLIDHQRTKETGPFSMLFLEIQYKLRDIADLQSRL